MSILVPIVLKQFFFPFRSGIVNLLFYKGGYDKEEKAARAYDLAALKYWGTSTTTNFPVSSCFQPMNKMQMRTNITNRLKIMEFDLVFYLLQISNYEKEVEEMKNCTRQEFVASIRRYARDQIDPSSKQHCHQFPLFLTLLFTLCVKFPGKVVAFLEEHPCIAELQGKHKLGFFCLLVCLFRIYFCLNVRSTSLFSRHHQHGRWQARIGRVAGNKDLYLGTFSKY